jgi:molybdopterin/thiamine biosynthesis adenylyltransferase
MTLARFDRHRQIEWFDQDQLSAARCVVVGAGAVGNEVLKNLALLGVGRIDVYDRDVVEEHNLTRSVLFRESDLGRNKVDVAATRARELGGDTVTVVPHHGDFWRTLTLDDLQAATRVYACVDNVEARLRLNRLCALLDVDFINIGIDSRFASVEVFPFSRGEGVACYECTLSPSAYARLAQRVSCGGLRRLGASERKVPTTIVTASVAASMAVSLSMLRAGEDADNGEPVLATRSFADTRTATASRSTLDRRDLCPGCSDVDGPAIVVPLPRRFAEPTVLAIEVSDESLWSGEKVVVGYTCPTCGDKAFLWRAADDADERLADCPRCGPGRRQMDVRDTFTWRELRGLLAAREMPGKFLKFAGRPGSILFELQEGCHV